MEKDTSQTLYTSLLPPSGRNSNNVKLDTNGLISDYISQMPDNPPKYTGHRRARSEIVTLPDDISFGSDLGVVGGYDGPEETEEDLFSIIQNIDKSANCGNLVGEPSCVQRSNTIRPANHVYGSGDGPRIKHHHSMSVDGCTAFKPEETSLIDDKKLMSNAKLAELALVDPKRAKRIWANRQSAVRSKERKMRYILELERKVQTLQTNATSLTAKLTLLQRDTHGLMVENNEHKLRLQAMVQQVHLQDASNAALKKEIHHLKILLTGHNFPNGGPIMNNHPPSFRPNQRFHPSNQTMLTAQQLQQLQIRSQNYHHQNHPFHQPQHQLRPQQQLHQIQQQQLQQQHQQQQHQHQHQQHQHQHLR